jgi:RimJ/RimL family protein N-acetyltransferase
MRYILETERLRLREFNLDDWAFIIELLNSAGWLQFIGDRNARTPEQAKKYLENGPLKSYQVNGYGLMMVETKDNKNAIGMCGMLNRDNLECPDIGFAFLPQLSGKGYALEAAGATMAYAKETLGIPKIVAITLPDNVKSIRLLEKIGLRYIKRFSFSDSKEELLLYSNQ